MDLQWDLILNNYVELNCQGTVLISGMPLPYFSLQILNFFLVVQQIHCWVLTWSLRAVPGLKLFDLFQL